MKNKPHKIKSIDKKNIRYTIILFIVLTAIFAVTSVVSAFLMPRKTVFKSVAGEDITTSALFYGKDGEDFFMASGSTFERRSLVGNDLLEQVNYLAPIQAYAEKNGVKDSIGSLFYFTYANRKSGDNLVIIDNLGNLFKFTNTENGLEFSGDCLLANTTATLVKMIADGDDLYVLSNYNNRLLVQRYDLDNISTGATASRYIWEVEKTGEENSVISFLTYNIKLWDFVADGDYLYLATDQGIFKLNKSFYDYGNVKFFDEADNAYVDYLRAQLKAADEAAKTEYGLTDEIIDEMTQSQMAKIFKDVTGIKTSDAKKNAANAFVENNEWCVSYDSSAAKLTVKNEYMDADYVSVLKGSMYIVPRGIAYSPKYKTFYIANSYDDSLYALSRDSVGSVSLSGKMDESNCKKTDVSFGGRKFHDTKSITLNKNANTLYIAFASDSTICIVDINGVAPVVLHMFEAGFDIQEYVGDAENESLYFLNSNKSADIKNNITLHDYVTCISPKRNEHVGVVRALLIIGIVLTVISAAIMVYAIRIYKSPAAEKKANIIKKDLIKHRFTYLALVPFIVLLIMFCYYEAVGSVVLSFFEYTRDNPSMNWNYFANYIRLFNEKDFLLSVGNTLFFMFFDVVIALVPPIIFAFFLTVMRSKGYSKAVRTAMFIPGIIPGVATMLIWRVGIFGETGVLNMLGSLFNGEPLAWLENTSISRWSLLLMSFPFIGQYLVFYGAMMNIPKDYYEAAELDGVTIWKRFFSIDLPLCVPQIIYIFIVTIINSAQNYARTYMLRSSGTITLAEKMYRAMTSGGADYGLSSAYAMVIFALLFVAIIINFRIQKKSYMGDSV